jgi:hypothetical protein
VECLRDVGVQLDVERLVIGKIYVALQAPLDDPLLELIAKACEDDIARVTAGQLPDLPHGGQAVDYHFMRQGVLEDGLQFQRLVLGHVDHLNLVAFDDPIQELDQVARLTFSRHLRVI